MKASIVNVVATASLHQTLDLLALKKHREIFHDLGVYGGRVAYFKTLTMEGRISLFPSGSMITVGTRSEHKAFRELGYAMKFLVKKGFVKEVKLHPTVHNVVVTANFGRSIDLEEFVEKTKGIYEPEQFPGVILKMNEPCKASILMFASGKAVIAGLKNSDQINSVMKKLEDIIEREDTPT
jgi:transcription initiation factor TFIID TATA-box-binding protein